MTWSINVCTCVSCYKLIFFLFFKQFLIFCCIRKILYEILQLQNKCMYYARSLTLKIDQINISLIKSNLIFYKIKLFIQYSIMCLLNITPIIVFIFYLIFFNQFFDVNILYNRFFIMKNRQNGTLYIFIIILTSIQSTIIHTYSSTYTQIVFPILTRASLATQYNHSSNLSLNIAPEAKWIWCGADCKCVINITIEHLFKLKCLSKNIYLHIAADNYYQAYINGIFIGSHYSQNNSSQTFNVSNIWCDNTFNLTIYAQNLNYWCQNFGGVIYAVVSEDCTHQKCPFMGLLQSNSLFYAIIAGICVGIVVFVIVLTTLICLCPINKRTKIIKQVNPPTSITQLNIISDICSICNRDKCDLITPCQHQFHLDCFIQAIQKNILCPNCQNKNIEIIKVIMCKKCQIYQHFEVLHKFFVPRVKLRQINMKHHFCNL